MFEYYPEIGRERREIRRERRERRGCLIG